MVSGLNLISEMRLSIRLRNTQRTLILPLRSLLVWFVFLQVNFTNGKTGSVWVTSIMLRNQRNTGCLKKKRRLQLLLLRLIPTKVTVGLLIWWLTRIWSVVLRAAFTGFWRKPGCLTPGIRLKLLLKVPDTRSPPDRIRNGIRILNRSISEVLFSSWSL